MTDHCEPTPAVYNRPSVVVSPRKGNTWKTFNPARSGRPTANNAELDRLLEVWDSMDKSLLTTLEEFEQHVLWPKAYGDIPQPSAKAVDLMSGVLNRLFYSETGKRNENVSEDDIATTVVSDVLNNKRIFPGRYRADLSQHKYSKTDATKAKVDAALYLREAPPNDGSPDWSHVRLFIEFKKGGTSNDPFDDKSDHPEAWADSRAEVRGQLLAYASNTFQYQHRTRLYSLLINGDEFRAMHWDRSGLIVTRARNYVEDPVSLLRFLWAFAEMDDDRQGLDRTATLLLENSTEYKLMDLWAVANENLDMPFLDFDDITRYFKDEPAAPAAPAAPDFSSSGPAGSTRAKRRAQQFTQPIFKYVRDGFRESLVPGWPRYRLLVGAEKREFLVAKPVFMSTSMFGRGTRGYIALDVEGKRFVFLKDSWRPFYEGVEPEGTYLQTMASKPELKALIVPTVVAHGDVLQQTTFVAEYGLEQLKMKATAASPKADPPAPSARGKKRAREEESVSPEEEEDSCRLFIHYRIAVEEVCIKMGQYGFRNGKQLARLIFDCVLTHKTAYKEFDLLHRDISTGNILILPRIKTHQDGRRTVNWCGLLIDWELAKYVPKDGSKQRARQPERTGTWQFMSVAYAEHPDRPVVVADDIESFFHVLLHHAVRYLRHSLGKEGTTPFISQYFDTFKVQADRPNSTQVNDPKQYAVKRGIIGFPARQLKFHNSRDAPEHPLNDLIEAWLPLFVARYSLLEAENSVRSSQTVDPPMNDEDYTWDPADDARYEDGEPTVLPAPAVVVPTRSSQAPADPEAVRALAALLESHDRTVAIFKEYITDKAKQHKWPAGDFVADQLDKTYDPKKQFVLTKSSTTSALVSGRVSTSSSKRPRLDTIVAPEPGSPAVSSTDSANSGSEESNTDELDTDEM